MDELAQATRPLLAPMASYVLVGRIPPHLMVKRRIAHVGDVLHAYPVEWTLVHPVQHYPLYIRGRWMRVPHL